MKNGAVKIVPVLTGLLLLTAAAGGADLTLLNGNVTLNISTAVAGQQPDQATNSLCQLQWTTLPADATKKITVQTSLAGPRFTLELRALSVAPGTGSANGTVTLSTTAGDLITGIPAGVLVSDPGSCTLEYSATATAANGTGTDFHTITFTIVDQ